MNLQSKQARVTAGALSAFLLTSLGAMSTSNATGTIGVADLSGPWAITLVGDTGCGSTTMLATGSLNSSGKGTVTLHMHSSGCGNTTTTEVFKIESLAADGNGLASLSCNNDSGCGWTLNIQVSADRGTFNLVDITDVGNNRLLGTAIHQ
jgi:hypothetical protein